MALSPKTLVVYVSNVEIRDGDGLSLKKGTVGAVSWRDRDTGNYLVRWRGGLSCHVPGEDLRELTQDERNELIVRYVMES